MRNIKCNTPSRKPAVTDVAECEASSDCFVAVAGGGGGDCAESPALSAFRLPVDCAFASLLFAIGFGAVLLFVVAVAVVVNLLATGGDFLPSAVLAAVVAPRLSTIFANSVGFAVVKPSTSFDNSALVAPLRTHQSWSCCDRK